MDPDAALNRETDFARLPAMGGEGGYRWGTSRKAALLARERRGRRDQTSTPTTS